MNFGDVDILDIPVLVEEKKLTPKDAVGLLAEKMQREPKYFCIERCSDEVRSELILLLLEKGESLFKKFDSKYGSFDAYFRHFLFFLIKKVKKDRFHKDIDKKVFETDLPDEVENANVTYESDEFSYKIAHFSSVSIPPKKKVPFARDVVLENDALMPFKSLASREQKTLLVLALKASFFITENHILRVANYCDISERELYFAISELRDATEQKNNRFKLVENQRNSSYYMHRKYRELDRMNKNSSREEKIHCLYDFHTDRWLKGNKRIAEKIRKISPSNEKIADVLGICERQVGYYLNNANNVLEKLLEQSKEID